MTCVKHPLSKRPKISFQDQLSLSAGQKYWKMLPLEHSAIGEHSAILSTLDLSIFEWPFYTGFTVTLILLFIKHLSNFS